MSNNEDHKASTKRALENYFKRQLPTKTESQPQTKREKPEKHITTPLIRKACRDLGLLIFEIDASSYDPITKSHSHTNFVVSGYPDMSGVGPNGEAVFIELKAPNCRRNLSYLQRHFLITAINHNAFACVTDCPDHFKKLWFAWLAETVQDNKRLLLLNDLPPEPKQRNQHQPITDDEGFNF